MICKLKDHRVYVCPDDGPCLSHDLALSGLIGDVLSSRAKLVAIPISRLGPDFLHLSSGVAGAILQKLVNYRIQVAVIGDVAQARSASQPLAAFIRESNRGQTVWFVQDVAALEARLPAV